MEIFLESIKCTRCMNFLDSPLILPCGHSVCNQHVTGNDDYHCALCEITHVIQKEGGFSKNIALEAMLKANIQSAKFCSNYEMAFASCKSYEALFEEFKIYEQDPCYFINKTIGELKIETDLLREEFKIKIDAKANEIIKNLNDYEQECKRNVKSQGLGGYFEGMNQQLNEWKNILARFDANESEWKGIKKEIETERADLEITLNKFKNSLLMEKLNQKGSSVVEFTKIVFYADRELKIQGVCTRNLDSKIIPSRKLELKLLDLCEFSAAANQQWKLLYRASVDGFSARNFHAKCDKKENTLTIIRSTKGYVFGGYTQETWDYLLPFYKTDKEAFIFSLINRQNEPIKMKIAQSEKSYAIACRSKYGPIFGSDIVISNDSNQNKNSYSYLGTSYQHPKYKSNSNEAVSFLAGSYHFQVAELEVFKKI